MDLIGPNDQMRSYDIEFHNQNSSRKSSPSHKRGSRSRSRSRKRSNRDRSRSRSRDRRKRSKRSRSREEWISKFSKIITEKNDFEIQTSENEDIGHQVAIVVSVIRVLFYRAPIMCTLWNIVHSSALFIVL